MLIGKVAIAEATFAMDKPYHYVIPEDLEAHVQPGMRVLIPFGRGNRRREGLILAVEVTEDAKGLKRILGLLDTRPVLDGNGLKLLLWLRERYFSTVYTALLAMLPTGLWYTLRDSYHIAPGMTREQAFEIAGRSPSARRILEQIFASGGQADLEDILNVLTLKHPLPLLGRMVEDGLLVLETGADRKVKDKTEKIAKLILPPEEAMSLVEKRKDSAPMRYGVTQLLCAIGGASVKEITYFTGAGLSTLHSLEKSGILALEERAVFRRAVPTFFQDVPELNLNPTQKEVSEGLIALADRPKAEAALLYGVTGSGKTQVYLKLIHHLLKQGKTALLLVPEIALTAKLLELFTLHFREKVAILHSALPAGERYDEWKRIRDGQAKVVLGTRSAVFAPLENLGIIILDEEHEGSYQSESMLRYHARDVAKFRCAQQEALLLLGSATPAVESMYAAKMGAYHLFLMTARYNAKALPQVSVVDMKEELRAGNDSGLSADLLRELEENFAKGEQSILFLNRRGSNRMVSCGECGQVPACPRCSVYLAHHSANGRLMCHHCGYSELMEPYCGQCGGRLHFIGQGTQHIETELSRRYPNIEVMRMDTDTVTASKSHEVLLERFQRSNIPVLVGTQMVAKGLDFANVTLVGVIDADLSLYVNNFRASERTFSLLTQVVGRAGRGLRTGRAVIQSYAPDHEIIRLAAQQDYDTFFEQELEMRRLRDVPPFGDLFTLLVSGMDEAAVLRVCMNLRISLERVWGQGGDMSHIFGPAPAHVLKINNRYRYQLTLKDHNTKETRAKLAALLRVAQADPATRGISITSSLNTMD